MVWDDQEGASWDLLGPRLQGFQLSLTTAVRRELAAHERQRELAKDCQDPDFTIPLQVAAQLEKTMDESEDSRRKHTILIKTVGGCYWSDAELHAVGLRATSSCRHCGLSPATLKHLLWQCPGVRHLEAVRNTQREPAARQTTPPPRG